MIRIRDPFKTSRVEGLFATCRRAARSWTNTCELASRPICSGPPRAEHLGSRLSACLAKLPRSRSGSLAASRLSSFRLRAVMKSVTDSFDGFLLGKRYGYHRPVGLAVLVVFYCICV